MIHIPAGPFTMGTSDQQIDWLTRYTDWAGQWREKGRFDREQPQQSVALPDYAIARYPVTVGEFRAFVDAGCREYQLIYDGIVRWRSGSRPPRSLARPRRQLGTSPRADFDESAYYHCKGCSALFVDHMVSRHGPLRLYVEGGGPSYIYDKATESWRERGT